MNKIAVNPTQFVTCRLCLEELGSYQIVPSVKEQISYCFDINVEPFDGLPQLICFKCEDILSEFSKVKKKFTEKQEELRAEIVAYKHGSHLEKFSGAEHVNESQSSFESETKKETLKIPKKRIRIVSSSSSDLECSNGSKSYRTDNSTCTSVKKDVSWTACYTKLFVCRICSLQYSTIKSLKKHITKRHGGLYKKHGYILKRPCQVTLFKTDGKPNITGSRCVVYSREKIVKNVNADYHIIYTTNNYKDNAKVKTIAKSKSHFSSDSSDNEIVVKHRRNKRLYSSSSSETVVLDSKPDVSDNDNNNEPSACIDLDDCSETRSLKNMNPLERTSEHEKPFNNGSSSKADPTTIREIINVCRNKYITKHYQDTNLGKNSFDVATKLQHKIFSIGRKVINKRIGVNCTPLLRFMEHKNLDIAWLPREDLNVVQDSNYIRIMPRRKNMQEKSEDNETGWVDIVPSKTRRAVVTKSKKSNNSDQKNDKSNVHNENEISEGQSVGVPDANLTCIETKILNANPVANPKQLPKKFTANELKMVKIAPKLTENTPQEDNNPDFCMPIITSTTSLAESFSRRDDNDRGITRSGMDNTITEQPPPEAPRIKVKPVSELMSAETLNRLQHPTPIPIALIGKGLPLSIQNITVPSSVPVSIAPRIDNHKQPNNLTLTDLQPTWQKEYMVLDTVQIPNTRTNSPYMYLKHLLKLNNIVLLDTNAELSEDFHCLIKFKVMYKQDVKNQPVMLCLALYCSKNVFCFKVKDRNNENLDITKMSPNWQWEVLKIYKGEVVNKLLSNAQKIGQDVFEYTNTFLCLLKSINIKQGS